MARKPKNLQQLWGDVFDEDVEGAPQRKTSKKRRKPKSAVGPWGLSARQSVPRIPAPREVEGEEDYHQEFEAAAGYRAEHDLVWWLFRAPGAAILWMQYYMPSRGRIAISARQRGHVFFEVIYSIGFWLGLIFLAALLLSGAAGQR